MNAGWYARGSSSGQGLIAEEGTGRTVAVAYAERDAPLIAAAPRLQMAVREALDELDSSGDFTNWERCKAELRAALEYSQEPLT